MVVKMICPIEISFYTENDAIARIQKEYNTILRLFRAQIGQHFYFLHAFFQQVHYTQ